MNIAHWLCRSARTFPDDVALASGAGEVVRYGEFARRAASVAGALRDEWHCAPGARIGVLAANGAEYLEALYAIWWTGAVAVPINAKLHPREAAFILGDAGAELCFVSPAWHDGLSGAASELPAAMRVIAFDSAEWRRLRSAPPIDLAPRTPDDLAWLFYTSGTTGKPKGAMLSHRNLTAMTFNYFTDVDHIDRGDCLLHAAPVSHGSGLYNFSHVLRGAAQVFPASGGFDPTEIVDLLKRHAGTTLFAAPTMVKRLSEHVAHSGVDTHNLKTIVYGGGPMYAADLAQGLQVFGNKFVQIYGQGESPMTITALSRFHHGDIGHPRHAERLASVGVAHSGVEVRVCDAHGVDLPAGEIGEVCVRGEPVMSGYWSNPAATAQALRGGWLWTGDMGALDADGFLTLKDRSKDLIISGGSNIYPREVEEVLLRHPAVAEVAVVGMPDAGWGEAVVAFVVLREGITAEPAALDRFCLEQIARFKRPKQYRFVDSLPKNNNGKVVKTALRERLSGDPAGDRRL